MTEVERKKRLIRADETTSQYIGEKRYNIFINAIKQRFQEKRKQKVKRKKIAEISYKHTLHHHLSFNFQSLVTKNTHPTLISNFQYSSFLYFYAFVFLCVFFLQFLHSQKCSFFIHSIYLQFPYTFHSLLNKGEETNLDQRKKNNPSIFTV